MQEICRYIINQEILYEQDAIRDTGTRSESILKRGRNKKLKTLVNSCHHHHPHPPSNQSSH